jgi:hypothetical protein
MYPTPIQTDDVELAKRIVSFLFERHVAGLDQININVTGGVVTLFGHVPSAYDKFLCVECCRHVAGVVRIYDALELGSGSSTRRPLPPKTSSTPEPRFRKERAYAMTQDA